MRLQLKQLCAEYVCTDGRSSVCGRRGTALLEQLCQLTGLVHGGHDVAAANELAVHVQLRDRRPVAAPRMHTQRTSQ